MILELAEPLPMVALYARSPFLAFDLMPRRPQAKTDRWAVCALRGGDGLGTVQWYSHWRRYVFYPHGGLFDARCLLDIAAFIDARMLERGPTRRPRRKP